MAVRLADVTLSKSTSMNPDKFDQIKNKPYAGSVSTAWTAQFKYAVIFRDGTKGMIRSPKSRKELLATGRYQYVKAVMPEHFPALVK
jgi:hypothetical protein